MKSVSLVKVAHNADKEHNAENFVEIIKRKYF